MSNAEKPRANNAGKPHCNCATSYPNEKGFCERCGGYYGPIIQLATATKNIEHYQACEIVYRKERDALTAQLAEAKQLIEADNKYIKRLERELAEEKTGPARAKFAYTRVIYWLDVLRSSYL